MKLFRAPDLLERAAVAAALLGVLSACGTRAPFVHASNVDSGRVVVCYNAAETTAEDVKALVREECKALNEGQKTAKTLTPRFVYQTNWQCRLFLPVAAHFDCWDRPPEDDAPKRR